MILNMYTGRSGEIMYPSDFQIESGEGYNKCTSGEEKSKTNNNGINKQI